MKRRLVTFVFIVLVIGLAWQALRHIDRILAWGWHLRHGQSLEFAGYSIPVPPEWYGRGDEQIATLVRSPNIGGARSSGKRDRIRFGGTVTASRLIIPLTPEHVDARVSFETQRLDRQGITPILRDVPYDGGVFACVGGGRLSEIVKAPKMVGWLDGEPASWVCWTPGVLELQILASDPAMDEVWGIVSGIRTKS